MLCLQVIVMPMGMRLCSTYNNHYSEHSDLEEAIPQLRRLLGGRDAPDRGDGDAPALKLRWKFLLSTLVFAISSRSHPIALIFEDLQWADEDTLGECFSDAQCILSCITQVLR